jgi:hypothetical protein
MLTKEIIYYTDCRLDPLIMSACQKQLLKSNLDIISVSLQPIKFGKNIFLHLERGNLTMFKQILAGLELSQAEIVFLCEHDVLYSPSHFNFTPSKENMFYYNTNVFKIRYPDGHALWVDDLQQLSGICAYRKLLLDFCRKKINQEVFDRHYEPSPRENWQSEFPNLDIRHDKNLTKSKWSKGDFRNQKYTKGWMESDSIPFWGNTKNRFNEILEEIDNG